MSSLVRATADGIPLEDFYCTKVGKPLMQHVAVPSYLMNDPDFDGAAPFGFGSAPPEESAETDDKSVTVQSATSGLTGTTANSLHTSGTKYMDLPEASRRLDAPLYNVLIMNVKGTENSILQCVAFPPYVQARIVLHKHMALSASHRKTQAFSRMDRLDYKSDPHSFEVQAISAYRELLDAKCSIKDYATLLTHHVVYHVDFHGATHHMGIHMGIHVVIHVVLYNANQTCSNIELNRKSNQIAKSVKS